MDAGKGLLEAQDAAVQGWNRSVEVGVMEAER